MYQTLGVVEDSLVPIRIPISHEPPNNVPHCGALPFSLTLRESSTFTFSLSLHLPRFSKSGPNFLGLGFLIPQTWKTKTMTTRGFDRRPYFASNHYHYRRRPPLPPPPSSLIVVLLRRLCKDRYPKPLDFLAIDDLIASIPSSIQPKDPLVFPSGVVAAKLPFRSRFDALAAVSFLWRRRIDGAHFLLPEIDPNCLCSVEELQRVKQVFVSHIESLLDGEPVNSLKRRAEEVEKKIESQTKLLRHPRKVNLLMEMQEEKKRLEVELEQIKARLEEFRISMRSVLSYLGGNEWKDSEDEGEVEIFKFSKDLNLVYMAKLQAMVMRECRRLSDGLPIYAWRRKVLRATWANKV